VSGKRFIAARERPRRRGDVEDYVLVRPGERFFLVTDELAASALLDWSEPVQLRLERVVRGRENVNAYDLVARRVNAAASDSKEAKP
jgi:hypothetical protein